jgi:uncharacterized membrane protein HdeD (DUF308 family)
MSVTEYDNTDEQMVGSRWVMAIAIVMIVLGIIVIAFPFFATITSTVLFGWIFIFAGISQITYTFQSRGAGQIVWKIILSRFSNESKQLLSYRTRGLSPLPVKHSNANRYTSR